MTSHSSATVTTPSPLGVRPTAKCFASRHRLLLTGAGALALFGISRYWASAEMLRWSLMAGLGVAIVGLLLRMWATGWLQKNDVLVTQGPYAWTRNPLYLGTWLITVGQCLMSGVPFLLLLAPPLCLMLYWPTMREEAAYLSTRYEAHYAAYSAQTPLFFPSLRPFINTSAVANETALPSQTFSWQRVKRCYKGFIAIILVLAAYYRLQTAH